MPFSSSPSKKSWASNSRFSGRRTIGSKRIKPEKRRLRSKKFLQNRRGGTRKKRGKDSPFLREKRSSSAVSPAGFSGWRFSRKQALRMNQAGPRKERRDTGAGPENQEPQQNHLHQSPWPRQERPKQNADPPSAAITAFRTGRPLQPCPFAHPRSKARQPRTRTGSGWKRCCIVKPDGRWR